MPQTQAEILSEPGGAAVLINGRLAGATPLSLSSLPPGTYGLRLEKQGYATKCVRLKIGASPVRLEEKLAPALVGRLEVDIQPRGAEVALDGELVGLTPLSLPSVPAGQHELVVRKTNFKPFSTVLTIRPGQAQRFADLKLEDRILEMLEALIAAEPYRAAHYMDKGHYLFVNNRMDEAVAAYIKAREVCEAPLELPPELGEEEQMAQQRFRLDDRRRLAREIEKHRSQRLWPEKEVMAFVEKYDQAASRRLVESLNTWAWTMDYGRNLVLSGQLTRAEQLFASHLERSKGSHSMFPCGLELLKVRLSLRNLETSREIFQRLAEWAAERPDYLLELGRTVWLCQGRVRAPDRDAVLALAEQAFRRAVEAARARDLRAECVFELANVLVARGHPAEAVAYYQEAVEGSPNQGLKEDRSLALAEALRLAGRPGEARGVYSRLTASLRLEIREKAKAGLELLGSRRP
jgi:tetratricopeptide (TPR) repeat protein